MFSVQPRALHGGNEKLASISTGTGIGHAQEEGLVMLEIEVLISKLLTVDGLASSTIVTRKVTTLAHEFGNDAVEATALVTEALLTSAESTEVFSSLGDDVVEELKDYAAKRRTAGGNFKENFAARHDSG